MSEVHIELRHTKTVMRQSQDKTWMRRDWAKTETCKYVSRDVSRRDTCLETPTLENTHISFPFPFESHGKMGSGNSHSRWTPL